MRYIEGKNPVKEAILSRQNISDIYIANNQKDKQTLEIINLCKERGIVYKFVDRTKIEKMQKTKNSQGIIAISQDFEYVEVEDIINEAKKKNESPFIVLLDGITDPQNYGAIIRSAYLTGAHGIVIEKRNSCPITPIVEKSSAGALEYVKIARVTNLRRTIDELKQKNIWIYASDINAKNTIYKTDFKGSVGIIIGSEGKGISRLIKEGADFLIKIPQKGTLNSFNASVAAGIIFSEILRQRSL
ncbi:23S rRNA (guanosine(2251)-2'-O)-methyltransferase RlmB [Caldicellulosiruptoraceae bacterium PP1]